MLLKRGFLAVLVLLFATSVFAQSVSFNAPKDNTAIRGIYLLDVSVSAPMHNVTNVSFYYYNSTNSFYIGSNKSFNLSSYTFLWNTNSAKDGEYDVAVNVTGPDVNKIGNDITIDNALPSITNQLKSPEPSFNDNDVVLSAIITDNNLNAVWASGNWNGSFADFFDVASIGSSYSFKIGKGNFSNQQMVQWRFKANDTAGNVAAGELKGFIVQNRAPLLTTIPKQIWLEDSTISINLSKYFSDLDGDDLLFSSSSPLNINVKINQNIANLTPDANFFGARNIIFYANDGINLTQSNSVVLNVTNVNDAPVLQFIPDKAVLENHLLSFSLSAADADNDALTYDTNATFGTLNASSGLFEWTPKKADIGSYDVLFSVSDGIETDSQKARITVESTLQITRIDITIDGIKTLNVPQNSVLNISPGSAISADVFVKNLQASDIFNIFVNGTINAPNLFDYKYVLQLPGGGTVTKTLNYNIPLLIPAGLYSLELTAEDIDLPLNLHADKKTVFLNVTKALHHVVVEKAELLPDKISCTRNALLNVSLANIGALDQGAGLTPPVRLEVLSDNINLTNSSIAIPSSTRYSKLFNLTFASKGDFEILVRATYFYVFKDEKTIGLKIENCAPVLDAIANKTLNQDELLEFNITASDFDNEVLTYSSEKGSITKLANTLAAFSWTPANDDVGINKVDFAVSDGSAADSQEAAITVINVNDAPVITSAAKTTAKENSMYSYEVEAIDIDGDAIAYSLTTNASGMSINTTTGLIEWGPAQTGSYRMQIAATDGSLNDTQSFALAIGPNHAPTANAGADQIVSASSTVELDGSGSFDIDNDLLTYLWNQVSGPNATLSSNTAQNPSFVPTAATYIFELVVNDGTKDSSHDTVKITAEHIGDVLEITKVKAEPDEPRPGETVTVTVKVKNKGEADVEGIELDIWFEDKDGKILEDDDGDDIEEDEEFDLSDGDNEEFEFVFDMPSEDVDDGDEYFVHVEVEGKDEDDSTIEYRDVDISERIEFQKEKHDIEISEFFLSPPAVKCDRELKIDVGLKNIGRNDEDDVEISIRNVDLDLNINKEISLDEEEDYSEQFFFSIGDAEQGIHPIRLDVGFSGKKETKTLNLGVEDCITVVKEKTPTPTAKPPVIVMTQPQLTGGVVAKPVPESKFVFPRFSLLTLLLLFIILSGLVIYLLGVAVYTANRKSRRAKRRRVVMKNF